MEETQEMSENEQLPEQQPTLEELVARITDENRHPEVDWGEPVGEEIW
jgi:antitoxin component of MazEF toxin-antitoxin module